MILAKYKVSGHSMMPYLKPGETIVASSIPYLFSKVKVGDVILFKSKDKVLVKRISKIDKFKYIIVGDNKEDSLETKPISKEQILAKMLFKV